MGCDIHLIVEHRNGNGEWHRVPHYDRPCDSCDGTGKYEDGRECYSCAGAGHLVDKHYDDRDYDVFAILADVRNGYGFAGIDTGDGFLPLAPGRGIPDDLSAEQKATIAAPYDDSDYDYRNKSGEWAYDLGEHSETWILWSELVTPNPPNYWTRETKKRGWVTADEYTRWKTDGKPHGWCGGVSGANIRHLSHAEMDAAITEGETDGAYTEVEWGETYAEAAERFLKRIGEVVEHIGNPDPKDVRLVMGFDS